MSLRMPAPETLLVKSVNWDFFITLTHAPSMDDDFYQLIKTDGSWSVYQLGKWWDQPTFEDQMSRLWRWHRKCARYLKLRPNEFCTAIRWEVGRGGCGGNLMGGVCLYEKSLQTEETGTTI